MRYYLFVFILVTSSISQASTHRPQDFLQALAGKENAGEQIYQKFCAVCHAAEPQIKLGAPRIGVKRDWQARKAKGLERMLMRLQVGLRAMPPRGGCFECSDEHLKLAVEYMLPEEE